MAVAPPSTLPRDWDSPGRQLVAVTPNDGADLSPAPCRFLWVGGAGHISIIAADDSAEVLISSVPAGTMLKISAKRVRSTGTTATLIVAVY